MLFFKGSKINKSNYNVMKWEKDRLDNEKLAKRIGIFSSVISNQSTKSKALLPILKNPRESTTRMVKKRMKKNYKTEENPFNFPLSVTHKRAKTTRRRHKRIITVSSEEGDKAKDLDIAKVCSLPEEREIIYQGSKKILASIYELEISKTKEKMYIAAVNKTQHSEHYIIDLEVEKGEEILKEFNNQLEYISQNLHVI